MCKSFYDWPQFAESRCAGKSQPVARSPSTSHDRALPLHRVVEIIRLFAGEGMNCSFVALEFCFVSFLMEKTTRKPSSCFFDIYESAECFDIYESAECRGKVLEGSFGFCHSIVFEQMRSATLILELLMLKKKLE